jgi:hypothetical protein
MDDVNPGKPGPKTPRYVKNLAILFAVQHWRFCGV